MTDRIISEETRLRLRAMIDGGLGVTLEDVLKAHDQRDMESYEDMLSRIEDIARRRIAAEKREPLTGSLVVPTPGSLQQSS